MTIIGNCIALCILVLIAQVFFRNKYFTKASNYYISCLLLTLLAAIVNTLRLEAVKQDLFTRVWTSLLVSLDFCLMLLLTTALGLYLVCKITEHFFAEETLKFAKISLFITYSVLFLTVVFNLPFEYIFSVNEDGIYTEGATHYLPYLFVIPQIATVAMYCVMYRKKLTKSIKRALIESLVPIVFVTILNFIYPEISVFVLAITLIELIFFLNFQHQRMGINGVTKLHDGRSFFNEINRRIKQKVPFKAYLISIRNLGIIKQNYGHKTGDELLYQFAFAFERAFSDASVFHMYGTNFTLVTDNCENAEEFKDRLINQLNLGVTYMKKQLAIDYIVAEHTWQEDESKADTFYEKLEHALAIAKETKQKYIVYTLDLEIARLRKKYVINRMEKISTDEGFEIWFQPIYSNAKSTFSSMEVLLRLKEKSGTFISPAEFIPIAEKTGQIVPITWFVIEETCKALVENPELDGVRASINLPMLHLVNPNFESRLNRIVDGYGVPHDRISFEFTERVILDDLDVAEKNMRKLASTGYTFYLDDFGVGYSNFNCVLRLPLKTVKLDMSLTSTTEKLKEHNNLVCILTDLFHDMGLNVVAEGAETSEQVELLKKYGVDGIQGYYFAKPMPLAKLKEFLKKSRISK